MVKIFSVVILKGKHYLITRELINIIAMIKYASSYTQQHITIGVPTKLYMITDSAIIGI